MLIKRVNKIIAIVIEIKRVAINEKVKIVKTKTISLKLEIEIKVLNELALILRATMSRRLSL